MPHLRKLRLISALLAAGALFPLLSQAQNQTFATANVPFAFSLGDRTLPAGTYQLRMSSQNILEIRGETQAAFLMVQSNDERDLRQTGSLVFVQGDQYQLKEIKAPALGVHLYCFPHRAKARQALAGRKPAGDQLVTVAVAEQQH